MAHATSPDGIHWKRLGELTELTQTVGEPKGNLWGWLARGEPAITHVDGKFHLYFTDVRCQQANCKGPAVAQRGISLATSADGHHFTQHGSQPVLLQTARYPANDGWEGYSTPWVYHTGTTFELYVDLFRRIADESIQTTISHYRSTDGVHFEEIETDIVQCDGHPWAKKSVRAPSVIEEDGMLKLWYAGDALVPGKHGARDIVDGGVQVGIGFLSRPK